MNMHHPHIKTANRLSKSKWGKQYETQEDAERALIKDVDMSGACLLAILGKINMYEETFAEIHLRKYLKDLCSNTHNNLCQFVEKRELLHGDCPPKVWRGLYSSMFEAIGKKIFYENQYLSTGAVWHGIPNKGTEARKEYDRWMRRKAKKQ